MTTRADLIETVSTTLREESYRDEYNDQYVIYGDKLEEMAKDILDAVLPQITTAEQLEALPSRSMLVDCDGEPAVKVKRLTVIDDAGMGNAWTVEEFAEDCLPATVVWQPQPEQETR